MTRRRSDVEQELFKAKKAARSLIRLKYSLQADDELNGLIPDIEDAVHDALADGRDWQLDVRQLVLQALQLTALPTE